MPSLLNLKSSSFKKVYIGGPPKSAGKTTFAMTCPGKKLILQYDLGSPLLPPGVDPSECWYRTYAPAIPKMTALNGEFSDKWQKSPTVGNQILSDIDCIVKAYLSNSPVITFPENVVTQSIREEIPLPDVLILDGMTELPLTLVDWILAVNKKTEAEDFTGEGGRPNYYKLWQKRIEIMRGILHQIIPLPATVILIGWETPEVKDQKPTNQIIPDIGGKLDNMVPGKVDAALRAYSTYTSAGNSYFIQTKPDGIREWVGIRGSYNLPPKIDVTIKGVKGEKSPWSRVFPD